MFLLIFGKIILNFADLHDQSQKITHFENNVFCSDFIDSPQNLTALFINPPAKTVYILGHCKDIVYNWTLVMGRGKSVGCEVSMNTLISDESLINRR